MGCLPFSNHRLGFSRGHGFGQRFRLWFGMGLCAGFRFPLGLGFGLRLRLRLRLRLWLWLWLCGSRARSLRDRRILRYDPADRCKDFVH